MLLPISNRRSVFITYNKRLVITTFRGFGIKLQLNDFCVGRRVTTYESLNEACSSADVTFTEDR